MSFLLGHAQLSVASVVPSGLSGALRVDFIVGKKLVLPEANFAHSPEGMWLPLRPLGPQPEILH